MWCWKLRVWRNFTFNWSQPTTWLALVGLLDLIHLTKQRQWSFLIRYTECMLSTQKLFLFSCIFCAKQWKLHEKTLNCRLFSSYPTRVFVYVRTRMCMKNNCVRDEAQAWLLGLKCMFHVSFSIVKLMRRHEWKFSNFFSLFFVLSTEYVNFILISIECVFFLMFRLFLPLFYPEEKPLGRQTRRWRDSIYVAEVSIFLKKIQVKPQWQEREKMRMCEEKRVNHHAGNDHQSHWA